MKVLVTGGSGVLGINLIRYLLARGYSEIVSLDVHDFDHAESIRIEALQGDIRDADVVARAVAGCRSSSTALRRCPRTRRKEDLLHRRGRHEDGRRCRRPGGRCLGSSTSLDTAVYGIPEHTPVAEDDPLQPFDPYSRAKIMAKAVCRDRDMGMCIPILRPKSFIGPERLGIFALLFEWASEGRNFPLLGKGANRYQFLDVADPVRPSTSA